MGRRLWRQKTRQTLLTNSGNGTPMGFTLQVVTWPEKLFKMTLVVIDEPIFGTGELT